MTVFLTFTTALAAGWIIDRLAFNGDLTGMIRDEISMTRERRKHAAAKASARSARDGRRR